MSPKSSVPQAASLVSRVLMSDTSKTAKGQAAQRPITHLSRDVQPRRYHHRLSFWDDLSTQDPCAVAPELAKTVSCHFRAVASGEGPVPRRQPHR